MLCRTAAHHAATRATNMPAVYKLWVIAERVSRVPSECATARNNSPPSSTLASPSSSLAMLVTPKLKYLLTPPLHA